MSMSTYEPISQSVHRRCVHLMTRRRLYCTLARAASVPMLCSLLEQVTLSWQEATGIILQTEICTTCRIVTLLAE
jgi:hypothetical protein